MKNSCERRLIAASTILAIAVLLVTLTLTPTHAAVEFQTPPQAAEVQACQACHGANGISKTPAIPNLAGQKIDYLAAQLKAYKNKDRKNDLMVAIASQLSDADMRSLAEYWSSLPATPVGGQTAMDPAIPSRVAFPANFPDGFTMYQTFNEEKSIIKRYA